MEENTRNLFRTKEQIFHESCFFYCQGKVLGTYRAAVSVNSRAARIFVSVKFIIEITRFI